MCSRQKGIMSSTILGMVSSFWLKLFWYSICWLFCFIQHLNGSTIESNFCVNRWGKEPLSLLTCDLSAATTPLVIGKCYIFMLKALDDDDIPPKILALF